MTDKKNFTSDTENTENAYSEKNDAVNEHTEENNNSQENSQESSTEDEQKSEEMPDASKLTESERESDSIMESSEEEKSENDTIDEHTAENNNSQDNSHESSVEKEQNSEETPDASKLTQSERESDSIMESSEEEKPEKDTDKQEFPDYSEKNRDELLQALKDLIENATVKETNRQLKHIKQAFEKRTAEHKAELLQKREKERKALREEGKDEEFQDELPKDEYADKLDNLLQQLKQKQKEEKQKERETREKNLEIKKQIVNNIENLINKPEAFGKTFNEFKAFQKQWDETGPVPNTENRNIWTEYNRVIENFYNYVQINKELRDLDLQKNTEAKKKLCEEAEALLEIEDVMEAQRKLQKLHDRWRETGPVYNEIKEELWERFKRPTKTINDKHQDRLKLIKEQQEKNLESKTYLCEKTEEALEKEYKTNSEWKKASAMVQKYQKLWNSIGYVPKQHNQAIYERFSTACDKFFDRMRNHFEKINAERQDNLAKKEALLKKAQERMESTDWSKDTKFYKNIQNEWKQIGPVPRKHSDKIWKQFRSACNTFFNRKREHFNQRKEDEKQNLELKAQLIKEISDYASVDKESDLEKIKEFQNRWQEIGFVPIKEKDRIIDEYNTAIDRLFERLKIDKSTKVNIKFNDKIQGLENADEERIWSEIGKLRAKIDEREKEINLWKNNLGFFANTKSSEKMKAEYIKRIERGEKEIAEYKAMIDKLQNL
jgi:hypothetical protein